LHVDLWFDGVNVLRDGGSFSYAAEPRWIDYFMGTESHNTCQFDARSQMPRVSRFLFADWLQTERHEFSGEYDGPYWLSAYTDYRGCRHEREIRATDTGWALADSISGPFDTAVLRWRLCPDVGWEHTGESIASELMTLTCVSSGAVRSARLTEGWESRHYLEKRRIPVFELELGAGPQTVSTSIVLKGH
jgi:hypothetical protein